MNAIRIHDREVLEAVVVQELFVTAFKEANEVSAQECWHWCREYIHSPNLAVIVARNDDSDLVGLIIGYYSPDLWSPDPWLMYLYSTGEKKVVDSLLAEVRVWGLGLGQKRFRWQRAPDVSDKAAARSVRKFADAEPAGSVIVGQWKETEDA